MTPSGANSEREPRDQPADDAEESIEGGSTFEDLGLDPSLVEALAAEGIEIPTPLQESIIPLLRRGNNVVGRAGPGAGVLVAYGAPLLDRIEPDGGSPGALVLVPDMDTARSSARSLARLAIGTGHRVAALDDHWVLPERADLLFATPSGLLATVEEGRVKLDQVGAVVIEGGQALLSVPVEAEAVGMLHDAVPAEAQRVVFALPVTPEVEEFATARFKRVVHMPPRPVSGAKGPRPEPRGRIHYTIVGGPKEESVAEAVSMALAEARHLLLYLRSDDRAADMADFLQLHGIESGRPGDPDVGVWLVGGEGEGEGPGEAGAGTKNEVATLSVDVPAGGDALERRHGGGADGWVLVSPRELPHLREIASEAGYQLKPRTLRSYLRPERGGAALRRRIEAKIEDGGIDYFLPVLERMLDDHDPIEVAAGALALLEELRAERGVAGAPGDAAHIIPGAEAPRSPTGPPVPAWTRLFVSLGKRDGIGPGDLVGAITGEAGIEGAAIGRVDVRESYSKVEVRADVAPLVIRSLNGTTMRGRSIRVDIDRGERSRSAGGGPGGRHGPPRGKRRPDR